MTDLLFYDIEVFSHNAFVVFKDINKKLLRVFHNNFKGLDKFIQGKTLVSFNGYHYDDFILHAMLDLKTPHQLKALNDRIISGEKLRISNYKFKSLDCFQQADPSMPGLKKVEGNLGKAIIESSVSFNIDRPLTDQEFEEVLAYCCYDTDMVVDIYKDRLNSYFKPKESLLEMHGSD